jgi:hypothetical protein
MVLTHFTVSEMASQTKSVCFAVVIFFSTPLVFAQEVAKSAISVEQIQAAIKTQLPAPPDGFVWHLYKNAVLPKPAQWNEREKVSSTAGIPITVYAASPEEFSETKQFEIGLTVQIISGSQRIRGIEAKKMALVYLKQFLDAHKKEEVLMLEQSTRGDFERTFFRFKDAPPGLKPIIVHKFILANDVTDSVHVFTFESPVESWEENWAKYGTPILSKVSVLPNVPPN